jgi:hypothetical protein
MQSTPPDKGTEVNFTRKEMGKISKESITAQPAVDWQWQLDCALEVVRATVILHGGLGFNDEGTTTKASTNIPSLNGHCRGTEYGLVLNCCFASASSFDPRVMAHVWLVRHQG